MTRRKWLFALAPALLLLVPLLFMKRERDSWQPRDLKVMNEPVSLAFSPDGKTLAVGAIGEFSLWDVETSALIKRARVGTQYAKVSWSPDGKTLAVATNTTQLWRVAPLQRLHSWPYNGGAVAWSPDGRDLAVVCPSSDDQRPSVRLWDARNKRWMKIFRALAFSNLEYAPDNVVQLTFSPDAKQLFGLAIRREGTDGEYAELQSWNVNSGAARRLTHDYTDGPRLLVTSQGKTLLLAGYSVTEINARTGARRTLMKDARTNTSYTLSPNARVVACGAFLQQLITVRDLSSRKLIRTLHNVGHADVMAFSPDNKTLAVGDRKGFVALYRLK